jgi:hypothetical protein
MKHSILFVVCAILLAGCGKDAPEASPAAAPVQVQVESVVPQGGEFADSETPRDLEFPHQLTYDRTRPADGGTERQVLLEILGDDPVAIGAKLENHMQGLGYEKTYEGESRGGTRMIFSKEGSSKVTVRVWPPGAGPVTLQAPGATGSVYINWLLPQG